MTPTDRPKAGKGAPGRYQLNQKAATFNDRRTKRERDRATKNRNAIRDSNTEG